MHIPDGFLSTPVWAALDAAAVPSIGYLARRAQAGFEQSRVPLLGVMGAFVFAAQMINFPVGAGVSGHLLGGALLAFTLGPAAAAVTLTAILAIQALVFQDGGVLALGANVLNMAVFGIAAAWIPYRLFASGRWRRISIFAGAALSVLAAAIFAIAELLLSGVPMPAAALGLSLALFAVAGALEGAITLAAVEALERMHPGFVRKPAAGRWGAVAAIGMAAVLLAAVGVFFASPLPDGLEKLALDTGLASRARTLFATPLADYEAGFFSLPGLRKAAGGLAGIALISAVCVVFGRLLARKRST